MSFSVDIKKRLNDFDLQVQFEVTRPDEILALLGPSGCGKSMALKCIAGVERPDHGRIVLGDRVLFDSEKGINLMPQRRRVGYLFQSYALFPNMNVLQNVMAGAVGATRAKRMKCAYDQIQTMRLEGLETRYPVELSGGQQQRCAMARILASRPELILLDEPFSALDGHLRWQLELELTDVLRSFPGGAVYVSHNRDEVYRLCDSVCVVSCGRSDPKVSVREFFSTPTTLAAALIGGCKNVSRATKVAPQMLRCDEWGITLETLHPIPCNVTHVGIRSRSFLMQRVDAADVSDTNAVVCTVDRVIDSTFSTIVTMRTPQGSLLHGECEKRRWLSFGDPFELVLTVTSDNVLPLVDGDIQRERAGNAR